MAWIESHQGLPRHPKTKKLSRKLGVPIPTTVGHLHMLWWWAMDYAPDGDLTKFGVDEIADACDWLDDAQIFFDALVDSKFIDEIKDKFVIHDWDDYVGRLLDKRKANTERKRKSRERHTPVTQDNHESHRATVPDLPNRTIPTVPNQPTKTEEQRTTTIYEIEDEEIGTYQKQVKDLIDQHGKEAFNTAFQQAMKSKDTSVENVKSILERYQATA